MKDIELFRKIWESRNPSRGDFNADTGEDMFWRTAELVAREYVEQLQKDDEK